MACYGFYFYNFSVADALNVFWNFIGFQLVGNSSIIWHLNCIQDINIETFLSWLMVIHLFLIRAPSLSHCGLLLVRSLLKSARRFSIGLRSVEMLIWCAASYQTPPGSLEEAGDCLSFLAMFSYKPVITLELWRKERITNNRTCPRSWSWACYQRF